MGWLDPNELRQVLPAETSAFPSPIPTQSVSSDEFMPAPQTAKQQEFEARLKQYGTALASQHGMLRRGWQGSVKTRHAMVDLFGASKEGHQSRRRLTVGARWRRGRQAPACDNALQVG